MIRRPVSGRPLDWNLNRTVATKMWDTCSVQLKVQLPKDIAEQAEEVQRSDPEFLSRVVLYGLTRRSIYRHLRETTADPYRTPPQGDSAIR
jgi:hypothetical protein